MLKPNHFGPNQKITGNPITSLTLPGLHVATKYVNFDSKYLYVTKERI